MGQLWERTSRITARWAEDETPVSGVSSVPTVVAQVDHRTGQRLERIVQLTDTIEAKQQAREFILPTRDPLDGVEALFEDAPREFGLMLGIMPRLKIAVRLARQS